MRYLASLLRRLLRMGGMVRMMSDLAPSRALEIMGEMVSKCLGSGDGSDCCLAYRCV